MDTVTDRTPAEFEGHLSTDHTHIHIIQFQFDAKSIHQSHRYFVNSQAILDKMIEFANTEEYYHVDVSSDFQ